MKTYKASDLFDIQISGTFPLDCEFVPNENLPIDLFKGPGIYFLEYKENLVYIGSFFGSNSNNNVLTQRWNKELATISMRGKHVTFNEKAIKSLSSCNSLVIKNPKPKGDYLTSKLRIEFACKNWNELKSESFLKDFKFYWLPYENIKKTKKELNQLTNQLRNFYKPLCNG
jgi:hypothetical protein